MKLLLTSAFGLFFFSASAQITSDALLFSDINPMITARSAAVGNALGALGGDISCLSMNPAGIAIYRNSEVVLTPNISFSGTRTNFADSISRDNKTSFNLGSLGLILAQPMNKPNWQGFTVGLSFNRIASFHQDFSYSGVTNGSRLVSWASNANGSTPANLNPLEEQLAYDTYLIDNPNAPTTYLSALTDSNYVRKTETVRQSGGINELAFAFGMNFKNKLYWGAGLGVDFLNYRERKVYNETEETGTISFKEMEFTETRRIGGVGANFRVGLIYRIAYFLRAGISAQTPSFFGNTERYYTSMYGKVIYNDTMRNNTLDSPTDAFYPHRLTTPWLVTGSLGFLLGAKGKPKLGFLSVEADYLNFRSAVFALKPNDTDPANISYINGLNINIDERYRAVVRVRAGLELVLKMLRIRAGYRFQSSPYQIKVDGVSDIRHDISFGLGLRQKHFFLDFTYVHTLKNFQYIPYASNTIVQEAITNFSGGTVLLTVGVRFGEKLE